jgi:phospholipid N-methyltransferase
MFKLTCAHPVYEHCLCLWDRIRTTSAFFKEFVQAPSHVGSICPSSGALTSALIKSASLNNDGFIVDLGAGSGIITENLLKAGVDPKRLLAVEISPGFAGVFSRRCPAVPLFVEDARNLSLILDRLDPGLPVSSIISSLPLRNIPDDLVREILEEIKLVLQKRSGSFIQYTYAWWMRYPLGKYGFQPNTSRIVLKNIPPAKVESYTLRSPFLQ